MSWEGKVARFCEREDSRHLGAESVITQAREEWIAARRVFIQAVHREGLTSHKIEPERRAFLAASNAFMAVKQRYGV